MYDYEEAVKQDIRDYIEENGWTNPIERDALYEELWTADSVTGNGSGSYTFSAAEARETIFSDDNAEDYIRNLIDEFGLDAKTIAEHFMDWEYWDVSIRCYLLGQCLDDVLDEQE